MAKHPHLTLSDAETELILTIRTLRDCYRTARGTNSDALINDLISEIYEITDSNVDLVTKL